MRLIVITANLMQRLAGLPTTPDITLLDLRKPKPHPRSHTNTTFRELTYIRWCCIDLSNAPGLPDKVFLARPSTSSSIAVIVDCLLWEIFVPALITGLNHCKFLHFGAHKFPSR